jgi:Txe/YoeB family toxin of Txe-Axe toxin-antitoxin module
MPLITLKETITKKIEIPMETLYELIENLTVKEREQLLERVRAAKVHLQPFKKAKIGAIVADFAATGLYEDDFLKDLEGGLKKSSVYK